MNPSTNRCMLLGDFDINLLNQTNNVTNFVNSINSYHFIQLITNPTRFSGTSCPSQIDHMWYNNADIGRSGAISIDFTDHIPCFATVSSTAAPNHGRKTEITF